MCLQCVTKAVSYGEVFPGFHLMKAMNTDYPDNPTWKEGQWGLVECNDPSIYFTKPFMKDVPEDDSNDVFLNFLETGQETDQDILAVNDPRIAYRLIAGAITKGYDPKEDGMFGCWLTDYLAKYLETAQIIE